MLLRHALPGALLPVVSYLGPMTAALVTGSVVIETIFSIPGIGRYFVQAALNRDYTVVMGVVIVYACLIIVLNLVVDLLYGLLDPKVRTADARAGAARPPGAGRRRSRADRCGRTRAGGCCATRRPWSRSWCWR